MGRHRLRRGRRGHEFGVEVIPLYYTALPGDIAGGVTGVFPRGAKVQSGSGRCPEGAVLHRLTTVLP
jgi:hypothetical protein